MNEGEDVTSEEFSQNVQTEVREGVVEKDDRNKNLLLLTFPQLTQKHPLKP